MDLFDAVHGDPVSRQPRADAPLAVRMRPRSLAEVAGQAHLLAPGAPLRRLIDPPDEAASGPGAGLGGRVVPASVILVGPSGVGKTTLAYLVALAGGRTFVELSAVTAGVKDVRAVIDAAKRRAATGDGETVLFIDEVHRFSKTQQDALLPAVENRWVTLIAATTENPSFSVISPLLSRSLVATLKPLTDDDVGGLISRAVTDPRGLAGAVSVAPEALTHLIRLAGGDARKALTILEAAAGAALADPVPYGEAQPRGSKGRPTTPDVPAPVPEGEVEPRVSKGRPTTPVIDIDTIERAVDVAMVRYDRDGDQHYDVISAFIKSIRGSDVDAALHYLARMVAAGEDPRYIARRLMVHASEDVGMADPMALQVAVAAAQAVALVGMPEGRIILAQATIHLATAPKSNAVVVGIDQALADVRAGKSGVVPPHLRDSSYVGAKDSGVVGYVYPHDEPHGIAAQAYLPDTLAGAHYYHPTDRGFERTLTDRLDKVRPLLNPRGSDTSARAPD